MNRKLMLSAENKTERPWWVVSVVLLILIAGLYGHAQLTNQPVRSSVLTTEPQPIGSTSLTTSAAGPPPTVAAVTLMPPTTPTENEALVRRVYDIVLNQGQLTVMTELFADQVHYRDSQAVTSDLAALRSKFRTDRQANPNMQYVIKRVNAQSDWVMVYWTASQNIPNQSPPAEVEAGYTLWKIAEGRVVAILTESSKLHEEYQENPCAGFTDFSTWDYMRSEIGIACGQE
jgi:hypothetical protein